MTLQAIVSLTILFVISSVVSEECKYKKFTSEHSFCIPRNTTCQIFNTGVTPDEKTELLKVFNEFRSKVAKGKETNFGGLPPAADMLKLEWDNELEDIAQKRAEHCIFKHDCHDCRRVDRYPYVGQNIFRAELLPDQEPSMETAVTAWYDELKDFNTKDVSNFLPHGGPPYVGHFTQVIWSSSYKVGCGAIRYHEEIKIMYMLVCNFGPGGNYKNKPLYKAGEACSSCPGVSVCDKEMGLCMVKKMQKFDGPCQYAEFTPHHSFCQPPNPNCRIFNAGLKKGEQNELVNVHNKFRRKIAMGKEKAAGGMPPAADMLKLEWDDELASIAQKFAERCKFDHDCKDCRKVARFSSVGQNLYKRGSSAKEQPSMKAIVTKWYNEVQDFPTSEISRFGGSFDGPMVGHFTQMIWSSSWKIGCGAVQYKEGVMNYFLLVCNYGPAGNVMDTQIYKTGKACSSCPIDSHCGKMKLCEKNDGDYSDDDGDDDDDYDDDDDGGD